MKKAALFLIFLLIYLVGRADSQYMLGAEGDRYFPEPLDPQCGWTMRAPTGLLSVYTIGYSSVSLRTPKALPLGVVKRL